MMNTKSTHRVIWGQSALRDTETLLTEIAVTHPHNAQTINKELQTLAQSLEHYPKRGRIVPELAVLGIHSYRELIYKVWRLIYIITTTEDIHLVAFIDSRRNIEDILLERVLLH